MNRKAKIAYLLELKRLFETDGIGEDHVQSERLYRQTCLFLAELEEAEQVHAASFD